MPEQPAAEKTEQPTPRKLKKAREKGQLPRSEELPSAGCIVALLLGLVLTGPGILLWMTQQMRHAMTVDNSVFTDSGHFMEFIGSRILQMIGAVGPLFLILSVVSILACVIITGFNYSTQALSPKWEALNPVEGAKKLVDLKSLVRLAISVAKLLVISVIVYFFVRDKMEEMSALRWAGSVESLVESIAQLSMGIMIRICVALVPIAAVDAIYQRYKYMQDLKMTKQEVREEHRDTDGSPEVRSRIRRLQMEMASKRMLQEVPKADVVLTNPTHVAVALKYAPGQMSSPVVVAKGADLMAARVREIAKNHDVPIIRRPELARTLYATVEPGQPIPQNLFVAVAEVLALIYKMRGKNRR